jgi:hypothetical protein
VVEVSQDTGLLDWLKVIQSEAGRLEGGAKPSPDGPGLERLKAVIASLEAPKPARPPVGLEEYVRQWKDYLDGKLQSLERRAIRNLCWHPETATSHTFQYYLDHEVVSLSSRALQGLVRSCHASWSPRFANDKVVSKVRARLERYQGPSRLLAKWRPASSMLLGPDGAERFGDGMLRESAPIKTFSQSWGIAEEFSPYVQAAAACAAEICRGQMDRVPKLREYLLIQLLPWQGWPLDRFKEEAGKTVLHPSSQGEPIREAVSRFVRQDRRLGDPRLPLNQPNWAGIRDAERRVIEWFSQFDIVFFFEHVLPRGKDPHGRKQFWLRYVRRVTQSRSLLNWDDRLRLETQLRAKREESKESGRIDGHTSAFLLDFGNIVIVEFSVPGNACYVYDQREFKEILPDFWTRVTLTVTGLKKKRSSLTKQAGSTWDGVHRPGWESDASQLLAERGVRP